MTDRAAGLHRRTRREVEDEVGPGTPWAVYDRGVRTPLNAVLDRVADALGRPPVLIWVDGGWPRAVALTNLPDAVAVWSTRHLELAASMRNLVVDRRPAPALRRDLARRRVLEVVAELALRGGEQRLAARSLLLAVRGQHLVQAQATVALDLDPATVDEASLALWCFAIAHEFGHFLPAGEAPDDTTVDRLVVEALAAVPGVDRALLDRLVTRTRTDPNHRNRPGRLRAEMVADGFAVETLIDAARRLVDTPRRGPLLYEILLAHGHIALIERCATLAAAAAQPGNPGRWEDMLHATAGLSIRSEFVVGLAAGLLEPAGDARWVHAVHQVIDDIAAGVAVVDAGLADAVADLRDPPDDRALLAAVTDDATGRAVLAFEHRSFVALAADGTDDLLRAVLRLLSGT